MSSCGSSTLPDNIFSCAWALTLVSLAFVRDRPRVIPKSESSVGAHPERTEARCAADNQRPKMGMHSQELENTVKHFLSNLSSCCRRSLWPT